MTPRLWVIRATLCIGLSVSIAKALHAQAEPASNSLVGVLLELQARGNQFVGLPPDSGVGDVTLFASLAALEGSTAPYGTSTGGFTFTFDPQLGVWVRSARSFGPAFADRSLTIGKGKLSAGINWLRSSYGSVAGLDLDDGELQPVKNSQGPAGLPEYSTLRLRLSSDAFVVFANLGVTNNFELGIAVPSIRHSLEGQLGIFSGDTDITGGSIRVPKTFAIGIGDVAIRGKIRLLPFEQGGIAALVEVLLPTGEKDDLRGLGFTRTLVSGIWSRGGRVSPHVNVGYEFWSDEARVSSRSDVVVKDHFKYAFGLEFDVTPRATILMDLVGRRLRNGGRAGYQTFSGLFGPGSSLDALVALPEGLNVISFAPGIKWNVWRSVLVTGSILASLENDGLRARTIPVIGLDWAF